MSSFVSAVRPALRTASVAGSVRSFSSTPAAQATLRELDSRIKSVSNIGKITKSMKMVAASRLARAQKAMIDAKAYGAANQVVFEQSDVDKAESPVEKILYIVTSSDRGLCGGIHSSVAKAARRELAVDAGKEVKIVALGDKPKQQLLRFTETTAALALTFNQIGKAVPTFPDALSIADLIEANGITFDKVKVIYNEFVSAIAYESNIKELVSAQILSKSPNFAAYEIEGDEIEGDLASFALANAIYSGLVEGHASEISARRNAMDNASKNAEDMIGKLRLQYNRMRQASITNELVDIITGASAL